MKLSIILLLENFHRGAQAKFRLGPCEVFRRRILFVFYKNGKMSIGGIISTKWSAGSYEDDDEDLENSFSTWWWNTKQKILEVPGLVVALFVKPDHDGIQNARDLVYQYGQAVKHIPSLLRRLAFKTRTLEDELHEVSGQ